MARLGELLVAGGLLTTEQVEQALRAQVMWGARLGTNLVELGLIGLEDLSTYLGRQHGLPAALARHFERAERELQDQLSPDLAELFSCVPLLRAGPKGNIVIASSSPLPKKGILKIAEELGTRPDQMIFSIAAELRIRYQLERLYKIPRPARFMRTPGDGIPRVPQVEEFEEESDVENPIAPAPPPPEAAPEPISEADDALTIPIDIQTVASAIAPERSEPLAMPVQPAELDDLAIDVAAEGDPVAASPAVDEEEARRKRSYVQMIDHARVNEPVTPEQQPLGRIAIRRVAVAPEPPAAPGGGNTLGEAARSIRRATDRDRVAELCLKTLHRFAASCEAATLLVIRGGIATTWKGFCRSGDAHQEINVPLDQPGLVPRATHRDQVARGRTVDLGAIDKLLAGSLGHDCASERDLVVVPIAISGQAVCVLAMITEADAPSGTAETIAAAVGAAFARLMRNASR